MPNYNPGRDNPNYPNPNRPGQGGGNPNPNIPGYDPNYDPNAPDQGWASPGPNVPGYDPNAPDQGWASPGYEPTAPARRRGGPGQNVPRQDTTQYATPSEGPFTESEWKTLIMAPLKVGKAMMFVAPSGPLGMIQEAKALSDCIRGLVDRGSPSPLLNQLAQQGKGILSNLQAGGGMSQLASEYLGSSRDPEVTRTEALAACQQATSCLQKASPQDASAYKQFVFDVAQKVAEAASEGGIMGIGGERVSEPEQTLLRDLVKVLGMQRS